jgi:hypothetical protein
MPDNEGNLPGITGATEASTAPQFATAEYAHVPGTERCRICGNLISGEYYRVNTQMACAKCAGEAQAGQPSDSHAAFLRALMLGAGAAVLGLILYATFTIVTGWSIGYLALAVGWLVAKGIMKGSNGVGGTRYQITAVLLTYMAISMASIPVILSYAAKRAHAHQQQTAQTTSDSSSADSQAVSQTSSSPDSSDSNAASSEPRQKMGIGEALGRLALIGLASPFLELQSPGSGILGLIILFVGLSIAFRMTAARRLSVDGPYSVTG